MKIMLLATLLLVSESAGAQSRLQLYADSVDRALRPTPGTLYEMQVERPAKVHGRQPVPRYPEELRASGVEGIAIVRFEVDTAGIVDTATFRVLRATRPEFGQAVREVLPQIRYRPAQNKGQRVRQVVIQPYKFGLRQ